MTLKYKNTFIPIVFAIAVLFFASCGTSEAYSPKQQNESYPDKRFDFPVVNPEKMDEETTAILTRMAEGSSRLITAVPGKSKDKAVVRAYEKTGDEWTLLFTTDGFFGKNGINADKREGDRTTPSGVFTFGRAFGVADDPGARLPYTKVTDLDVWVDDSKSKYYNQWVVKNVPDADWNSAEQLIKYHKQYKYALAINYNVNPVVPGKGSAIFFHCSTGKPTAGCISVPEAAMIFFLVFVDEETRIAINK